ncbi:uncharacterized protein K460DRAFT_290154 [Cucurbitaria berberidis CBS 394.84]|uniref:RBR-type E3 ubiquitin transferase n=1 Tax=Cucurbitaria berberidis CBS 394.84 TaxID=1168544 RepID=A0A9P4L5M1_9PLEO|nr:uncharacterized protein K460DRAFT_290154 [Cucurbitaria berberidis CBS 394.84]KAF1842825.1 hypothetical protein K460DRAFT_290154 [Cucurbitaria berberidis CBS 394.84]
MDPATARLALKIQLDDVDTILKTLTPSSHDANTNDEKAAFEALRSELVKTRNEVHGQVYAYNILKEENANRTAFKRLLTEEQQAERDHEMACRLAGKPVPQRPAVLNKRPGDEEAAADQRAEAVNGTSTGSKELCVSLDGSQTAGPQLQPQTLRKRPIEEQLVSEQNNGASKKAHIDDEADETTAPQPRPRPATPNKRTAFLDPAVLREIEDGRTKRARREEPVDWPRLGLDGVVTTAPATVDPSSIDKGKGKADPATQGTCSSCLDMHPTYNMLQLPCKEDGEMEPHAYCRECIRRLFESSVTDPSHFPPRCCSKIIPLLSCTPFLPRDLIARFMARREELETANRTYCSNTGCSKWVRPVDVVGGVATCSVCTHKTCATCKGKQHDGLCPEDKDVKELMSVAQQKRWQTCPNCKEMVELEQGCYHITYVVR